MGILPRVIAVTDAQGELCLTSMGALGAWCGWGVCGLLVAWMGLGGLEGCGGWWVACVWLLSSLELFTMIEDQYTINDLRGLGWPAPGRGLKWLGKLTIPYACRCAWCGWWVLVGAYGPGMFGGAW